jgi:6-phosphofructokinase 1
MYELKWNGGGELELRTRRLQKTEPHRPAAEGGTMQGNAVVGQAGGPSAVINASLAGVIETVRQRLPIETLYGMHFGIEGFLEEKLISLDDLDGQRLARLARTPGSALGSCRYKLGDDELPEIRRILEKYDIRYFFYIGGNDTMDTINRIERYCRENGYELTGIGIPKTVDNDLPAVDHTPGYPSAARYVALSVQQGGRLAADMQRVDRFSIYQTVGRDAGWLAAAAALGSRTPADPPHLIYVPERPLKRERVLADVERTIGEHGWASIVVGEGIIWEDGTPVSASMVRDRFSNVEFGAMAGTSAAIALHRIIGDEFGYRGEFQIPESLQMCADDRVSEQDRREARAAGGEAVRLAAEGESGRMVTIDRADAGEYRPEYGSVPLEQVALQSRPLPEEYIAPAYVTSAFLDYLQPLAGTLPDYETLR